MHAPFSATPTPPLTPLRLPTLVLFASLLLFDASGVDMAGARLFGDASGFALRNDWLLTTVFHSGGRALAWGIALWLCVGVRWPVGVLRRLDRTARSQLALTTLLALAAVSTLKSFSASSCPWDMAAFGSSATHVSHWLWTTGGDGGRGRCFPAGHASAGFAFIGGFFAFRRVAPGVARCWLLASVAAGLALGLAQQARGAHFTSHTLWTGAICWCVALAVDAVFSRTADRARER